MKFFNKPSRQQEPLKLRVVTINLEYQNNKIINLTDA